MMIGETGTGKTTLLNSMTNVLFNVKFEDKFRYKLINEDEIAKTRKAKHESMTDDVTAYYLEPTNPKINYNLTVIDTPGFGDTRGLDKDQEIINKIKKFFEQKMNIITGVCLVVKASNTRLTAAQKYIFATLLGLFGKDIVKNIFVLITFCDAKKPPCIGALRATKTPFKARFKLNNSAFFLDSDKSSNKNNDDDDYDDDSEDDDDTDFNKQCWNMGVKSFEKFFATIAITEDKGLKMTKDVLKAREILLASIDDLHRKINQATSKLSELESLKYALEHLKDKMNQNKEFTIQIEVEEDYKEPLPANVYTTVCVKCRYTCHRVCGIPNDDDKRGCYAMSGDNCRFCTNKCHWSDHANRPYTWERRTKKETKTDKQIKEKYGKAEIGVSQAKHVLSKIEGEIFNLKYKIVDLIKQVSNCNDKLKECALRHSPIDSKDYIELMIKSEKNDMKPGWQKRVKSLENLKGMWETLEAIDNNNFNEALKKITLFDGSKSIKIEEKKKKYFGQSVVESMFGSN